MVALWLHATLSAGFLAQFISKIKLNRTSEIRKAELGRAPARLNHQTVIRGALIVIDA